MIVLARIFETARMEIPLHLFVGQNRGFMATTFLMPLPLWRTNLLLWAKSEGKSSIFLSIESLLIPIYGQELDGQMKGAALSKVRLTRQEFAKTFHLSLAALRDWEQRRVRPDHPI